MYGDTWYRLGEESERDPGLEATARWQKLFCQWRFILATDYTPAACPFMSLQTSAAGGC